MTTLADALASGARYVKWDDLGSKTPVSGTIQHVEMRQARKFQSTDLDYWDDGKPKMQAVITFSTDQRDPSDPEDDGTRSVSINLWSGQKAALVAACKAAGVNEPQPGQTFTATWTGGVGRAGDPRVFSYALSGSPSLGGALGVDTATGEVTQRDAWAAQTPNDAAPAAPAIDAAAAQAALANLTPEQRAALGL